MDRPTRRAVLAGGAAAAAGVTGCSTYGEPESAPASSAPAGSAQAGVELAKTSAIPVGGGVIFGDNQVVVTQPTAGTFKAFTSVCTHAGCQVASVADGTINCNCHGSKFSISDGSVVHDPAPKPLAAKKITVSGGSIKLA